MTTLTPYGFRTVGPVSGARRLTDWSAAFAAHCRCAPPADPAAECYLSLFAFGDELRGRLRPDGSTLDTERLTVPCYAPWLWLDIDAEDLDSATA